MQSSQDDKSQCTTALHQTTMNQGDEKSKSVACYDRHDYTKIGWPAGQILFHGSTLRADMATLIDPGKEKGL